MVLISEGRLYCMDVGTCLCGAHLRVSGVSQQHSTALPADRPNGDGAPGSMRADHQFLQPNIFRTCQCLGGGVGDIGLWCHGRTEERAQEGVQVRLQGGSAGDGGRRQRACRRGRHPPVRAAWLVRKEVRVRPVSKSWPRAGCCAQEVGVHRFSGHAHSRHMGGLQQGGGAVHVRHCFYGTHSSLQQSS